ncbi:nuclear factor of activated T-cells, cytoplasmic 3 [Xenentodon cancila]
MSTVNYSEELDFRLIFEDDGRQTTAPVLDVKAPPSTTQALAEQLLSQELQSYPPCFPAPDAYHHAGYQSQEGAGGPHGNPRAFDCPSIQITSIAHNNHVEPGSGHDVVAAGGAEGGYPDPSWSRDQLFLPMDPCYRETALCPSPCSSLSSRSWMSDLSSCESFCQNYDDVEAELHDASLLALGSPIESPLGSPGCGGGAFGVELWQQKYQYPSTFSPALSPHQSPRQSPCHSPRTSVTEDSWLNRRPSSRPSSRPTSPCGKRRHSSADPHARSPSPHHSPSPTPGTSPRGSVTDDTWAGNTVGALGPLLISGNQELDVPSKTRRTSGSKLGISTSQGDPNLETYQDSPGEEGREQDGLAELFLQVPAHFSWNKPKLGNPPLFRTLSPPPLDWPLPNQFDHIELKLEVQPKSYHRAHYETEGSRGSIKAPTGGHPVIGLSGYSEQPVSLILFIGTADDRGLRPHSFYQVHRVTGKTVTTICQEKAMGSTRVLEVPLLPENNMSTSIDCAGILKLRNADIELKKGETDIGRKNTRVRVVFRVGVPQQDGLMLWLQTASLPIECSQRSGQDLPQVDSFSPASCCVDGGEELLITGANISAQSRVVFIEKGPDGRVLWEMDARVVSEKSNESSIVVEVPPYNKKTTGSAQVQFYISNGKRRKSLMHNFVYLSGAGHHNTAAPGLKKELWEPDNISYSPPAFCPVYAHAPSHDSVLRPDAGCYESYDLPVHPGLPSQNAPLLHHPLSSSLPLQASLMFPQASTMPPQAFAIPAQMATVPSQASSVPLQSLSGPGLTSSVETLSKPSLFLTSRNTFKTPPDSHKDSLLPNPGEVLSIKQEPEDQPNLGSMGLQTITLDDVNEIIDRDICCLSSSVQQRDQFL